jgi:hypothetical protein
MRRQSKTTTKRTNGRLGNLLTFIFIALAMSLGLAIASAAVTVESNLVYGAATDYRGSNVLLTLDAYYASGAQTNRPVILLTHGGGFGAGDKGYTVAQGNFYPNILDGLNDFHFAQHLHSVRQFGGDKSGRGRICEDENLQG